ncbi:hypothetical protein [Blastopirellula marina]|uniref:Uncharacterized protein n=1 Tax=Blastopirellula marina TaxID=124 RepID=A0A2S8G1Z9_9BACT|nr:hypothetical protein [Blastopirellula marina]PQO38469.1 hypothetical protein C5Y98_10460 [Blastopirellula marina]PTL45126.1 hypothetical protein C5Y97_10470 [Blastopirellula marina]
MSRTTQLGAIKSLFHALELHDFSDSEIVGAGEAFLYIQARFGTLKRDSFTTLNPFPHLLHKCIHEFEFVDLVLARVRTFLALERPLDMQEMVAATNAIQFLSRKLIELRDFPEQLLGCSGEGYAVRELETIS